MCSRAFRRNIHLLFNLPLSSTKFATHFSIMSTWCLVGQTPNFWLGEIFMSESAVLLPVRVCVKIWYQVQSKTQVYWTGVPCLFDCHTVSNSLSWLINSFILQNRPHVVRQRSHRRPAGGADLGNRRDQLNWGYWGHSGAADLIVARARGLESVWCIRTALPFLCLVKWVEQCQ